MAEDMGDKTEAPTAKRRQEAREQGNIARSHDLTAAVLLLGFLMLMQAYGNNLIKALKSLVGYYLSSESLGETTPTNIGQNITQALLPIGTAMAPLLIGGVLLAVVVNLVQVGLHFNTKRLQPNLGALNPLRGLGKIFKGPGLVQLIMNLLKMFLITMVAWSAVQDRLGEIILVQNLSFVQAFSFGGQIIYAIALRVGIVLLILALIDYGYQRFRIEKELKMTKQEVKDEMRSMEGDPKIKQRRRQLALQMLQRKLKKDVPTADVVVTNPTEFAIALKYDGDSMHAPRVIAKGQGFIAQRIREIAIAAGVPILERKPLARALYKLVEVGQEIPEQFYSAVAEILAYVYELSGKLKGKALAPGT